MNKVLLLIGFILMYTTNIHSQETLQVKVKLEFVDNSYNGYQDFAKQAALYLEKILHSKN